MNDSERDPRTDPRQGDVLELSAGKIVITSVGEKVGYMFTTPHGIGREAFAILASRARVLHRAEG